MRLKMSELKLIFKLASLSKFQIRYASINSSSLKCPSSLEVSEGTHNLRSWREIPGPSTLPVVGQLHHFLPGGSLFKMRRMQLFEHLYKNYGPVVRLNSVLKPDIILLFDAENIAKVLYGENRLPVRPEFMSMEYYRKFYKKSNKHATKLTGLVTEQGLAWKEFRSKVGPAMLLPKLVKLYSEAVDEVALDTTERWRYFIDKNIINENIDKELNLWALESIGVIALGCRLNCLDLTLPKDSPVHRLIECTHDLLIITAELDYKSSVWKYYPTKTFRRAMKVYEEVETITKYYIGKAVEDFKNKSKTDAEKSILEKLLDIDEDVAHVMAADMLVAGIDTTSQTMLATMYLLATNPEKQNTLRQEILSNEQKKPYLKACLKESMRILPVIGLNFRQTTKSYNIMDYEIPKGMGVVFCHHMLAMMDSEYPKAKEFIPERWIVDEKDPVYHGNAHPFTHLPFGFGVRSCIGQRIAELQLEMMLARVIQNFHLEWNGGPPEVYSTHFNYVRGPFHFKFNNI